MTELGIDGRARYAFVAPRPANGTSFTVTDLLKELTAPHMTGPGLPDQRGLISILKTVSINDVCPVSGMTPLLWAIENGRHIAFCFLHGADPSKRGTGDYDCTPVELASRQKNFELVENLLRRGAEADPALLKAIADKREAEENEIRPRAQFVKDTIDRFKRESKTTSFQEHVRQLESLLGVSSSVARGRGMQAFAKVPIRALAKANHFEDDIEYLASMHELSLKAGFTLFCERGLDIAKVVRLLLAPTIRIEEVVAASNLLPLDDTVFERVVIGTALSKLNDDYPFQLLECGRDGVSGQFRQTPEDTFKLAGRLLEICPHYGSDLQAGHGRPWENVDDVTAVRKELEASQGFHFSWD
ncbi:MAG: hypothetical protein R3C20_10305 [Planctomycetaceae bacterium]